MAVPQDGLWAAVLLGSLGENILQADSVDDSSDRQARVGCGVKRIKLDVPIAGYAIAETIDAVAGDAAVTHDLIGDR